MAESSKYNLIVIGSGPGGYVAAIRSGQWGLKTAVIEKDAKLGGACLHVGCIPTKSLLFNAEVYGYFAKAKEFGISCENVTLDWAKVLARKERIVRKFSKGIEFLFKKNKVEWIPGRGRLAGLCAVSVEAADGQTRNIEAKHIVLATGSEAQALPSLVPDGITLLTNRELLEISAVPASLAVIGAGAVGVEFASLFASFGTKVTLIEMLPRIVPLEDEEVSLELARSLQKQGIAVHTETQVQGLEKSEQGATLTLVGNGKEEKMEAEKVLLAVGRAPNTGNLGLENTKITLDEGFIKTGEHMETAEPNVYAIGDIVAASPQLAHVAEAEGIVAVEHAAGRDVHPINYRQIPGCTYCEPQVASVGLTEQQARDHQEGYAVKIGKFPFSANSKAAVLGAPEGFVKIVSDEKYGEILGVHMVGPGVTELIGEAVMAMRLEGTVQDLAHAVHAHPTLSEAILEAAHAAGEGAIHI